MATRYSEGDTVDTPGGPGVVGSVMTKSFEVPLEISEDPDFEEVKASESSPTYVVAHVSGGFAPYKTSEMDMISENEWEDIGEGKTIDSPDEAADDIGDAEMASVYDYCGDTHDVAEMAKAKKEHIIKNQRASLMGVRKRRDMSLEELQNIPGVDDPHVGFQDLPNGWTHKTVLDFWTTVGGTWRSCVARMSAHFGPNMTKRFCSAAKDELYGEHWRGRF